MQACLDIGCQTASANLCCSVVYWCLWTSRMLNLLPAKLS